MSSTPHYLVHCTTILIILFIHPATCSLFGLFSNPAINQDVVWLNANSTSIAHTSNDVPAIMYDENVQPAPNITQPGRSGLRGILYERNETCSRDNSSLALFFNAEYTQQLPRIALVKAGGPCTFVQKIRIAQDQEGAVGVIVYDENPPLENDYVDDIMSVPADSGITIPTYYVDPRIGSQFSHQLSMLAQRTVANVQMQQAVRILMLPGSTRGPNPWELTLIIMIVLLGIGFLTSVAMHCHLLRKNRRLQRQVELGLIPPPPEMLPMGKLLLEESQLEHLPLRTVQEDKSSSSPPSLRGSIAATEAQDDGCVICLEKFDTGEVVRELPCHHEFHQHCIDPWLTNKAAECPLCKYDLSQLGRDPKKEQEQAAEHEQKKGIWHKLRNKFATTSRSSHGNDHELRQV